jgi:hypothetical protein
MSYVTLPAAGSQIYVLPLGSGYLPASALALSDGTTIGSGSPLPVAWSTAQHVIVDSATLGVVSVSMSGTVTLGAGSAAIGSVTVTSMPTTAVTAASLPLPTGAATAAKQPALGTAGTASADVLSVQGIAGGVALLVDGSSVTQPVSGTVALGAGSAAIGSVTVTSAPTTAITAASLPLPSGAATSAKQPALGTAGTPSADVITVQGASTGTALPVSGTVTALSATLVSAGNSSTTTLSSNATFTGASQDCSGYSQVSVLVFADVASATNGLSVQVSSNGSNWDDVQTRTVAAGTATHMAIGLSARYCRVVYTNGSSAQSAFRLSTTLLSTPYVGTTTEVDAVPVTGDQALLTQAVMVGKTTAGGGAYVAAKVNPSGSLSADVSGSTVQLTAGSAAIGSVTVTSAPTTAITAASLPLPSGAATSALQGGGLPAALGAGGGLKVDGSGTALPVSGTVTANIGTSGSLALDATLTGGTQIAQIRSGAKGATSAAAVTSTASGTDHQALDVALYDASGARLGTSSNALRVDPTGTTTQPVSGTVALGAGSAAIGSVTANIGTSGSLALDATLTGGTTKAVARGGAKGTTTAADITGTASGSNHQALDVALYDASGNQLGSTTNRLITQPHDGTNPLLPNGAAAADASSNATVISQIGARLASYNGSTWDRVRSAVTSIGSTFTGMLSVLPTGIYNSSRTTRTTGQGGPLETDSTGSLLVTPMDANGNMSGINGGWDFTNNSGSALPAAGLVVKASAGVAAGFSAVNGTGGSAFLQIHNLSSATGYSASTMVWTAPTSTASAGVASTNLVTGGIRCSTGIVFVWSSTQFTYTSIASNTGAVIVYYK